MSALRWMVRYPLLVPVPREKPNATAVAPQISTTMCNF